MVVVTDGVTHALEAVELDRFNKNAPTQMRQKFCDKTIADYVDVLDDDRELPPITVYYDDISSDYWIIDGWHRFYAHDNFKAHSIDCVIVDCTARGAIEMALSVNSDHGLPLTLADRQHKVEIALEDDEWGRLSDRDLSKLCKVTRRLVKKVRAAQLEDVDEPSDMEPEEQEEFPVAPSANGVLTPKPITDVGWAEEPSDLTAPTPKPSKNGKKGNNPTQNKALQDKWFAWVRAMDKAGYMRKYIEKETDAISEIMKPIWG